MKWWIVFVVGQLWWTTAWAWGSEKVLLRDISAITLHQGQMTTGRRSSPVPQLKCIGGTAGCNAFIPNTVQCMNVGYDGYDVQWECKTDMDDSYRFGKIQVTCEGYDYPNDPYILKGSCGLEYTNDLTKAGNARKSWSWSGSNKTCGGWFIFFVVVFTVVFLVCKKFSSSSDDRRDEHHRDDTSSDGHRPHSGRGNPSPPPYGFKPEYSQSHTPHSPPPSYSDATHATTDNSSATNRDSGSSIGGFWSGLGYLFGNRRSGYYRNSPGWGWNNCGNRGWGNSWGNRGWGNSWGGGSSWGNRGSSWGSGSATYRGSSSSGTSRTTSGFGGTSRR